MQPRFASLALPLLAVLMACGGPPPEPDLTPALQSLRADAYDPHHGLDYWTQSLDRRDRDDEWDRAVAFCAQHKASTHPNCHTIELLHLASRIPGFSADEVLP